MSSSEDCGGCGYHWYNFDLYNKGRDTLSRESSDKVNKEVTRQFKEIKKQFKEGLVIDEENTRVWCNGDSRIIWKPQGT